MRAATILLMAFVLGGCYRTTIVSGLPEGSDYPPLKDSNHGGYVNGIAETNQIHLDTLCDAKGWASIHVETGFINGVTNLLYGLIYHQENVTLTCAKAPAAPSGSTDRPASVDGP